MKGNKTRSSRKKLGETLIDEQILTSDQLQNALRRQNQTGGRLGSKLVEMSCLEADKLVEYLSGQLNHPVVNLLGMRFLPEALGLLTFEQMKTYQAIPVAFDDQKRVILAVADPGDNLILEELPFLLGRQIKPTVVPAYQLALAFRELGERKNNLPEEGFMLIDPFPASQQRTVAVATEYPSIWSLCASLSRSSASDLLLVAGAIPSLKQNNELVRLTAPILTPEQVEIYARALLSKAQLEAFQETKEIDFALTDATLGRFRINIYYQRNTISIAIRHIIEDIPSLKELNLPAWLESYALKSQGLILVTGPNGHGKSTTLAAMIDIINTKCRRNIITIEDPIEYLHQHKNSNVNQREVGIDTHSFHSGLKRIYRESPDVILIGEMRDRESIAIALEAADTGHLVLSSLHANNSILSINRIIDVFPADQQQQIRIQLADNLLLAFNQRLVKTRDGRGRIPAYEKLSNSYRVANLIREGKGHQIRNHLVASEEFFSLDASLANLVKLRKIDRDTALHYCLDQKCLADLLD
jgi:twitching motility protein PilT